MSILLLDDATISKIAAGEIIENPASVVKELIENSIDANAKNITIEVKNSSDYLRVTDDGSGIQEDDIGRAFLRHSTSKLKSVEDLKNIYSLGFRGEALASISHVSKIKMMTKSKEDLAGTMVEVENGKILKKKNMGMPEGTTFYIRDLFYNTPVRRKFLKSDNTEFNNIMDVVKKIALGNSNISFHLIRDGRTVMQSVTSSDYKNHIYSILGKEIADNLIETEFNSHSYKVKLYLSNNRLFRSNRNHQYIYINRRYVRNSGISKEIERLYHSLIPLNRHPVFIAFIEIDPILVDVNIHPKKNEVKLSKENNLLAILGEMVEEVLYPNRKIPMIEMEENTPSLNVFELFHEDEKNTKDENNHNKSDMTGFENLTFENQFNGEINEDEEEYSAPSLTKNYPYTIDEQSGEMEKEIFPGENQIVDSVIDENLLHTKIVGILFKTYIILENSQQEILFLIDQHAAHERILYEKYKKMYTEKQIDAQILLQSEILELSPEEYEKIEKHFDLFQNLGFEIENFGENSVVIRSVPMIFGLPTYKSFIRDIIDSLDEKMTNNYEADLYQVMRKACRSAVKAGDRLSNQEVYALVDDLIHCDNPYTCPHGRPTIIDLRKSTISKLFLRE